MKTISVAVSESDYNEFRSVSRSSGRSIALLIREAMAFYRQHCLDPRQRLTDVTVLPGHQPRDELSLSRTEIYDEIFDR